MYPRVTQFETRRLELERELRLRRQLRRNDEFRWLPRKHRRRPWTKLITGFVPAVLAIAFTKD